MESLFDTINVRDLLWALDLSDPNSSLFAPDLRLLIQRSQIRSQTRTPSPDPALADSNSLQIRSQVQSYLVSHRDDFANLFSVSQTRYVSDDVSAILCLLSDLPIPEYDAVTCNLLAHVH
ncbi:hypothetical protein RJT34_31040 [Clitoria ternatea]|uniref:Uncharacterized protein n=1 Tax=Clitoria ternatea TaxID=43366 RepID=A0AAN9EVP0_CLITE